MSKAENRSLMHTTFTKISVEDIYSWIRFGVKELVKKKECIIKTFQTCGYIDADPDSNIDELSINFERMEIENEGPMMEPIPLEEDEIDNIANEVEIEN